MTDAVQAGRSTDDSTFFFMTESISMNPEKQNAEALIERLLSDEAFREKVEAYSEESPDEFARQLVAEGYQFTEEQWRDALARRRQEFADTSARAVPDEQLAGINGGSALVKAFYLFDRIVYVCQKTLPHAPVATTGIAEAVDQIHKKITGS